MAWHHVEVRSGLDPVSFAFSDAADGDFAVDADPQGLERRRAALIDGRWTWLRQVHGDEVVLVRSPGDHAGAYADAAVTNAPGAVLAVQTADCAGVLLRGSDGDRVVIGAAHAGWRGLVSGVLERTVGVMTALGATKIEWLLGPCIGPESYEFGASDLTVLADRFGPAVRAATRDGAPALDLRAGVRIALAEVGATPLRLASWDHASVPCTATGDRWFSWWDRPDISRPVPATPIGVGGRG
ncbi:MAG: polyphenol oxidase family protein, partial [Actinomycetes bacterium]